MASTEPWAPDVADVGALLRARTKDTNGVELGTFAAVTRPTADQVVEIIEGVAPDVKAAVSGHTVTEEHHPLLKGVTAIGAAMAVELSYFPEQVATGRSPYNQLAELYDLRLGRLITAVTGTTDDGGIGAPKSPVAVFPPLYEKSIGRILW